MLPLPLGEGWGEGCVPGAMLAWLQTMPHRTDPDHTNTDWHAQELLLMREVMKLVGRSLAPAFVLREMLHLMSELLGLNRGRMVLADEPVPGQELSLIHI